jgi:hypothetical protein
MRDRFVIGGSLGARGSSGAQAFGVAFLQGNGTRQYYCATVDDGSGSIYELVYTYDLMTYTPLAQAVVPGPQIGAFTVTIDHVPPGIECHLETAAGYDASGAIPSAILPDNLGFVVKDLVITLDWFVQIRR